MEALHKVEWNGPPRCPRASTDPTKANDLVGGQLRTLPEENGWAGPKPYVTRFKPFHLLQIQRPS